MARVMLTVDQYKDKTGLSRREVLNKMKKGLIPYETTEGGGKYQIPYEENEELEELAHKVDSLTEMMQSMMNHFGVRKEA